MRKHTTSIQNTYKYIQIHTNTPHNCSRRQPFCVCLYVCVSVFVVYIFRIHFSYIRFEIVGSYRRCTHSHLFFYQCPVSVRQCTVRVATLEASSQKFSEYIQNGVLREVQTIQTSLLGPRSEQTKGSLLSLASLRQPFCMYSESF